MALIEVVLVAVMAIVTTGSLFLASSANMHALQHGGSRTELQARASRLMERVLRAVHEADRDSLAGLPMAPVPLSGFTYDEPQSVSELDGTVTEAAMRIQLEYEPGDPNDGVDNDGDELVDEGRVVLIRDFGQPGQLQTVLCSGVRELLEGELPNGADDNGNGLIDERGLCVTWDGARMAVRVTLEKLDARGRSIVHSLESDARVMN